MLNDLAPVEARKESRRRTVKKGLVLTKGANAAIECTLQNWSHNGARLDIGQAILPGTRLSLKIFFGELEIASVKSTVRWHKKGHIGVEFDAPLPFDIQF